MPINCLWREVTWLKIPAVIHFWRNWPQSRNKSGDLFGPQSESALLWCTIFLQNLEVCGGNVVNTFRRNSSQKAKKTTGCFEERDWVWGHLVSPVLKCIFPVLECADEMGAAWVVLPSSLSQLSLWSLSLSLVDRGPGFDERGSNTSKGVEATSSSMFE